MNVGTVEAKLAVDASDLEKLPAQARATMQRAQQEFEKAAKGITAAFAATGSGIVDQFGKPAVAATKAAETIAAAGKKGADGLGELGKGAQRASGGLDSVTGAARRVFEVFTGFTAANAIGKLVEMGREAYQLGLQSMQAERALRGMLGVNTDAFLTKMRAAADGLADMSDTMLASARAVQQGLNQEQLVKIMDLARERAKLMGTDVSTAFNLITDAITQQSPRALKQANIIVDMEQAYRAFATRIGTVPAALNEAGRAQAVYDETIRVSTAQTKLQTTALDVQVDAIKRNEVAWTDLKTAVGEKFVEARSGALGFFAEVRKQASETADLLDDFARRVRGLPLPPIEGAAGGIGTSDIVRTRGAVIPPVDPATYKNANALLLESDQRVRMLTASFAAGQTTLLAFEAALRQEVAGLQALGKSLDADGRLKLLGFQAALVAIDFTKLEQGLAASLQKVQGQEAVLLAGIKELVAAGSTTIEQAAVSEAAIRVQSIEKQMERLARFLAFSQMTEVQRFQFKQQYEALGTQLEVVEIGKRTVLMEQQIARLRAVFAARSQAFESSLADDLNAIKQFHDREMAILQVTGSGPNADSVRQAEAVAAVGLAAAQATFDKTEALLAEQMTDTVLMYKAGLFPTAEAYYAKVYELAQRMNVALKALGDARVTTETAQFAAILAAATKDANDTEGAWKKFYTDLAAMESARVTGTSSSQGRVMQAEIADRKKQIAEFVGFAEDKEGLITQLYLKESQNRMRQFTDETDARKAQQLAEQEFYLRAAEQRNTIDARIAAAAAATWSEEQFAAGNYFTFLTSQFGLALASASDFYNALKTAGQDTARAVMTGFSDGFFAIFTGQVNTLSDVFKNFGLSMVRVLANFLASEAVAGLLSLFKWLIGGMSGSFDSGGLFGTILTGAGALIAKFASSSSSGIGPGTGTDPTGGVDNLTTSANGAAGALNTVTNSSALVSAGLSAFGVGLGLYSLTQGGSPLSMGLTAAGTALSLYSLAQSVSVLAKSAGLLTTVLPTIGELLASGLAAIAPELAASIGAALVNILPTAVTTILNGGVAVTAGASGAATGVGAFGTAIAGILESIQPFLELLSGVAAGFAIFGAFVSMGFEGMATDAEDAAISFKQQSDAVQYAMNGAAKATAIFADLGTQLDEAHLVGTLHTLHDAVRDLGNLDLAAGLNQVLGDAGAEGITKMIPGMRATVGAAWLAALDAAFKQGINITPGAENAPNSIGETLQAPNRVRRTGNGVIGFSATGGDIIEMQDLIARMDANVDSGSEAAKLLVHLLETTADNVGVQDWLDYVRGQGAGNPANQGRVGNEPTAWELFMTPERIAQIQGHGGIGDIAKGQLDIDAINRLLDGEYLAMTLRNAVVDVGALFGISKAQMGGIGAGEGNWRGTPGAGDMPSVAAIADVQTALEAAGFVPGKYADALKAYLISIDAGIVNNPMWKKFTDALEGKSGDIQAALNAALIATMTPTKFYDTAKVFTDNLVAEIKKAMASQADMLAAGESQDKIDAVGKLIEAMQAGIKAYAGLVQLYTGIPLELAAIAGDLEAATAASIDAWQVSVKALGDNVHDAQAAFDEALKSGNIIAIQQTAQQLHDTTLAGYQMMLKAVEQINAAIKGILDQAAVLVQMVTQVAKWDIGAHGNFGTITALMDMLGTVAGIDRPGSITKGGGLDPSAGRGFTQAAGVGIDTTRPVTPTMLWAVDQAIKAIIATLPSAIAKFGANVKDPGDITRAVVGGAAPFLAVQQTAINQASGGAKLGLLQQQASDFNALAAAAVAGVQQWADIAISGAQKAAQAELDGLAEVRDARLAAVDAQIEATNAEIAGLQELTQKSNEFAAAVESMGQLIQALKVGPLGPGNPADKLSQAQGAFAKALQAYNAAPTAAGLTGLQGLAQTMLSLAEPIFTKPSPQFQALSATTIKQLEAANALAAGQVTDSQILKSQLETLQAQLKALGDQKTSITKDFETATKAINDKLEIEVKRINDAAAVETTRINDALAAALKENFAKQVPLLEAQYNAANAQLTAIGDTKVWQDRTKIILENIAANLALAIVGATPPPGATPPGATPPALATGAERVTEGLYHLHDDEMVIPKHMADRIRSAAVGAGMSSTSNDLNDWSMDSSRSRNLSAEGFAWGGPRGAELNRLEATIRLMQDQYKSMLMSNTHFNSRHQIVRTHDAAQLAAMQSTMLANIDAIHAQQQAIIAMIPPTPPPGTPPTTPPSAPPSVPPGPPWLHRGDAMQTNTGGGVTFTLVVEKGAITGVADPDEVVDRLMDKVEDRILRGDWGRKILQRKPLA